MEKDYACAYGEAADSLAVLTHLIRSLGGNIEGALTVAVTKVERREKAASEAVEAEKARE